MIYYVRHGQCEANNLGLFAGRTDSPLTDTGKKQAQAIADKLKADDVFPDKIVSSSLSRARDTAQIIAQELGYPLKNILVDTRFDEYDFGSLNGKPKQGIDSNRFMATLNRESPKVFVSRIAEAWNEYCREDCSVLVVSHSFVKLGLDCALEKGNIARFHDKATHGESHETISRYQPKPI